MYWVNTKEKFYGSWDDNRQNGLGIHIWLESKGEGKYLRNRYDGEWDTGQRHGVGTFYYANGAKYEGKWNRNLKDGYALFTNEAGKLSFSVFKDDKLVNSLEMERKPQIIENLEGNFENNLEVMKEMLNQNQEEILINKEERLPSANKSKLNANSPSMRKTKKKLFSDKKDGSSHNELAEFK